MTGTASVLALLASLAAPGDLLAARPQPGGPAPRPKAERGKTPPAAAETKGPAAQIAPAPPQPPAPAAPTDAEPFDLSEVPAEVLQALDTVPPRRLAIIEFRIAGDQIPTALSYQLQDGFVLGLVRNGVQVIDQGDLPARLRDEPELIGCMTSPCLRRLGEKLRVRFTVTVEVQVTGNSYRMIARIFRTTGAAPAALPIETQSRFCDICTVTEARDAMLRLADGVRVPDEPEAWAPEAETRPRPAPAAVGLELTPALAVTTAAVLTVALGSIMLGTSEVTSRGTHAAAGSLMTIGAGGTIFGLYSANKALRRRREARAEARGKEARR